MIERIDIKARWDARKESAVECAARMLAYLQRLEAVDEVFAQGWVKCGNSLPEALRNKVLLSQEFLEAVLQRGRSRRDANKAIIEELGFYSGRFWNGLDRDAAHITVHCGAYVDPGKMPGINEVEIELPQVGAAADRLLRLEKLAEIITVTTEEWNPDWVRVSTFQMDEAIYGQRLYRGQRVGWLTYVSSQYGPLPALPQSCRIIPVKDIGSLVVIDSITRISVNSDEDVRLLRDLSAALEKAGFLTKNN